MMCKWLLYGNFHEATCLSSKFVSYFLMSLTYINKMWAYLF